MDGFCRSHRLDELLSVTKQCHRRRLADRFARQEPLQAVHPGHNRSAEREDDVPRANAGAIGGWYNDVLRLGSRAIPDGTGDSPTRLRTLSTA